MSGLLEIVECPLCGFEAEDYGTERGYDLKTCSHCSLVFVHPMPEKEELQKYYEGVHEQIHPQVWSLHGERVRVEILAGLKKKLPTGRVLDVGSGAGHFLDMLKNAGYDAYGVEPAADVSPNGPVLAHHISDLNKNAGPFDAIVMMWALEHMPDPDAAIAKAREMLKPGGILVVRVPNMGFIKPIHRLKVLEKMFPRFFKSLINPASNKQDFFELLGPPYHLYGYSPSTARRLMEGQGFKLERIGIDGGLSTGKGLRDGLDKILEFTARVIYAVSGGRIVFFYDLTAWARKGQGAF